MRYQVTVSPNVEVRVMVDAATPEQALQRIENWFDAPITTKVGVVLFPEGLGSAPNARVDSSAGKEFLFTRDSYGEWERQK